MQLAEVPLALIVIGLAAYVVLAGADFGAGLWQLVSRERKDLRDHAHRAMAPVWEANHVWLIFVLVIAWTCYPEAFGSIASTLAVPLFLAALGIIMRGAGYALQSGGGTPRQRSAVELMFSVSSVLTPFALGTVVGAVAAGEVPVGNAAGDELSSWTGATSILIGLLAVATSAYLAAVYLAADAARIGRPELIDPFRRRALIAAVVAGALALAGLLVLRADARDVFDGLTSGLGLLALLLSAAAGVGAIALVLARRLEPARYSAAVAVGAIVAGWPLAQGSELLPGLTIEDAAASDTVLIAVLASVGVGMLLLLPSLGLLFSLVLRGRFDTPVSALAADETPAERPAPPQATGTPGLGRAIPAVALVGLAGAVVTILTEGGVGRVLGIALLLAFVLAGAVALLTPERLRADEPPP